MNWETEQFKINLIVAIYILLITIASTIVLTWLIAKVYARDDPVIQELIYVEPEQLQCNDFILNKDTVQVTVYHAVKEQCNEDVLHTAFMFKLDLNNPYKHKIVAVSRDLLKKYPNGTRIKINGTRYDGIYTVRDKMNKRFKKRIDILINQNMKIGSWENIVITQIN